jgi:hypothetical protein
VRLYSAYRALSRSGIGNHPQDAPGPGDQYLDADPEIWHTPELPEALSPWLTLSIPADYPTDVLERLEAWTAVTLGDWQVVGRMCPVGDALEARQQYFGHGRGWRLRDWNRERSADPGVWLADEAAFAPPRVVRETGDSAPALGGEVARVATLCAPLAQGAFLATAAKVCAWLMQAIANRTTVVCRAPLEEFMRGGSLAAIVSVARAALPFEAKRAVRIRLYTDTPQVFLDGRAHLLALPTDLASNIAGGRILGFANGVIDGPLPEPRFHRYATAALSRALKYPDDLLAFTATAGHRLSRAFASKDSEDVSDATAIVYNLVSWASRQGWYDALLEQLQQTANTRSDRVLPWADLITPQDWQGFSPPALVTAALAPTLTDDARALRALIRTHLPRDVGTLDNRLLTHWLGESDDGQDTPGRMTARAREAIDLLEHPAGALVSESVVADLLRMVTPEVAGALLCDERHGATFARLVGSKSVPDEWLSGVLAAPPAAWVPALIVNTAHSTQYGAWQRLFDQWVALVTHEQALTTDVIDAVLGIPAESLSLQAAVAHGDFAAQWDPSGTHADRIAAALWERPLARETRAALVERAVKATSPFLHQRITVARVIADAPPELLPDVIRFMDRLIASAPRETVKALIQGRFFGTWLAKTSSGELQRVAALHWLELAEPPVDAPLLSSVAAALAHRLTEIDLERVWRTAAPNSAIRQALTTLLPTLVACAADLGVCAWIADKTGRYEAVEAEGRRTTVLFKDLPNGVLALLSGTPPRVVLTVKKALLLMARAGDRRRRTRAPYVDALLRGALAGQAPDPVDRAHESLWNDVPFQHAVATWLCRHFDDVGPTALRHVDAWIAKAAADAPIHDVFPPVPLAAAIAAHKLHRLGKFLRSGVPSDVVTPGVMVKPASSLALSACGLALCTGDVHAAAWRQLALECQVAHVAGVNPLVRLARELTMLNSDQRQQLRDVGLETVERVFSEHPPMYISGLNSTRALPAFTLFVRVGNHVPLWKIACALIDGHRRALGCPAAAWIAALVTGMRTATRLSGARDADDSFGPAFAMTCAWATRVGDAAVATAVLAFAASDSHRHDSMRET